MTADHLVTADHPDESSWISQPSSQSKPVPARDRGAPKPSIAQLDTRLRRYCRSLTRSRWDAEDLAQDAWAKALKTEGFERHPNQEALLVRIAKTTWIDRLRRQAAAERLLPPGDVPDPEQVAAGAADPAGRLEMEELFRLLVERLSPLQRSVFILRDVLGFSGSETARLLNISEGAVKAALHRARRALETGAPDRNSEDRRASRKNAAEHRGESPQVPAPAHANADAAGLARAYIDGDVAGLVRRLVPAPAAPGAAGASTGERSARSTVPAPASKRPLALLCGRAAYERRRGRRRLRAVVTRPAMPRVS